MEDARENLHAIHFEPETVGKSKVTTIHATATDGHRMIHLSWIAGDDDVLKEEVNISASEVKDFIPFALKSKKKEVALPKFILSRDGTRADSKTLPEYILSTDKRKSAPVSMGEEITYPEWRQVIPRIQEGQNSFSHKFGINITYLVDFGKYLNVCGMGYAAVVHYSDEQALGPIRFTPGGVPPEGVSVEIEYILMPVRT